MSKIQLINAIYTQDQQSMIQTLKNLQVIIQLPDDQYLVNKNAIISILLYTNILNNTYNYVYDIVNKDDLKLFIQQIFISFQHTKLIKKNINKLDNLKKKQQSNKIITINYEPNLLSSEITNNIKQNPLITEYKEKLQQYQQQQITYDQLTQGLTFNNGVFYKDNIPVLLQSQIKQEEDTEDYDQSDQFIEQSIVPFIQEYNKEDKIQFIEQMTNKIAQLSNQYQNYIKQQQFDAVDYMIKLIFLVFYKYTEIYDDETYQLFLNIFDTNTLYFRQQNNLINETDFNSLVDNYYQNYKDIIDQIADNIDKKQNDNDNDLYEFKNEDDFAEKNEIQVDF